MCLEGKDNRESSDRYIVWGGPDVLQLREVEKPAIGDHQVLIKVEAASVNFADVKARYGNKDGYAAADSVLTYALPDDIDFETAAACLTVSFYKAVC